MKTFYVINAEPGVWKIEARDMERRAALPSVVFIGGSRSALLEIARELENVLSEAAGSK